MKIWILTLLTLASCIEQPNIRQESTALDNGSIPIKKVDEKRANKKNKQKELVGENLSLKITESEYTGFGFEILQGTSPLIIQPHIPAIQGIKGFKTKEQASIIGNYMIYKINHGIMPPSISVKDLDSLDITY
jgi:hypothetical protein